MFCDDIIEKITSAKKFYEQLLERYEVELQDLPEGSLCCKQNKGKTYLYLYNYTKASDGSGKAIETQRYLSKDEQELMVAIKRRHFIKKSLPYLYNIIDAFRTCLEKYEPYDPLVVANGLPMAYCDLPFDPYEIYRIPPNSKVQIDDIKNWKNEYYEKSNLYPENLKHGTSSGIKVRSKSECIIAELLDARGIPFRYEAALELGGQTYYPDFTILRPKDGEIIYWEHFGMADNDEYNASMMRKLMEYNSYGITLWNQLITTFEAKNVAIDVQHINKIIELQVL